MKHKSDSSLTPIFFRAPRPARTDLTTTTHTLAALAAGPIATVGNPHWQAKASGLQRLTSPKLARLSGTQEATHNPPLFSPLHHSEPRYKASYGSIGSTASRTTTLSSRSSERSPSMRFQGGIYSGEGLGIQGLLVNSSFEAATGIGMGSNYRIPSHLALPHTPDNRIALSSRSSPRGRLLTPGLRVSSEKPAQIRPARLATRKHRSSSISVSEKSLETVELDGEGRRMEKRARFDKNAGLLQNEKISQGNTIRRRQSGDGDPFRTPELRVVNMDS